MIERYNLSSLLIIIEAGAADSETFWAEAL